VPYEMDPDGAYIVTRFYGVLTAADLLAMAREAEVIEAVYIDRDRLTDLTAVEHFDIDFEATYALAELRRKRTFGTTVRSAIIAIEPIAFGSARMFQTLNDNPQIEIRIVASRAEAEEWFAAPRTAST
jgi:hypothetical protein